MEYISHWYEALLELLPVSEQINSPSKLKLLDQPIVEFFQRIVVCQMRSNTIGSAKIGRKENGVSPQSFIALEMIGFTMYPKTLNSLAKLLDNYQHQSA